MFVQLFERRLYLISTSAWGDLGMCLIYRMAFASGDLLCQPFKFIGGLIWDADAGLVLADDPAAKLRFWFVTFGTGLRSLRIVATTGGGCGRGGGGSCCLSLTDANAPESDDLATVFDCKLVLFSSSPMDQLLFPLLLLHVLLPPSGNCCCCCCWLSFCWLLRIRRCSQLFAPCCLVVSLLGVSPSSSCERAFGRLFHSTRGQSGMNVNPRRMVVGRCLFSFWDGCCAARCRSSPMEDNEWTDSITNITRCAVLAVSF